MDLIKQLPISSGFTAILVVINQLTKQGIFIPIYNFLTAVQLAKLFVLYIFSKHGIPSYVTSNCGSKFVFHFFCGFSKALNMNLHFMTTPVSSTLILSVSTLSALLLSSTSLQPHIPSLSPLPITSPLLCSPNLTVAASSLSIFSLPPFPVAVSPGVLGQEFQ